MNLALGRPRADRAPGDQVAEVLRRDDVEKLAAGRHPEAVDLEQQLATDAQAFVDAVGLVEIRVVDQAFPADRGARLLEVDPHHDLERVGVALALGLQAPRVLDRGHRVVDRARADDHQQPIVLALHDPSDRAPRLPDQRFDRRAGDREEADQMLRRRQRRHIDDPQVVGLAGALAARIPTFAAGAGLCLHHDRGPFVAGFGAAKKNRRSSRRFWSSARLSVYALASPAAERCENQKYAKKRTGNDMARNVAREPQRIAPRAAWTRRRQGDGRPAQVAE